MMVTDESRDEPSDMPLDLSPPPPVPVDGHRPLRLAVPLLLAAGWGALLTFSVMFLLEDGRGSVAASDRVAVADRPDGPGGAEPWTQPPPPRIVPAVQTAAVTDTVIKLASATAEAAPVAPPPPQPVPIARVDYVGTWGPTALACGSGSRRRGYLPASITEDGAKAGRTLCRFRNGRRDGIAWTMAADCSERGRRWTSQVRLVVDGDRLTWTSAKGAATYVRCGRRDG